MSDKKFTPLKFGYDKAYIRKLSQALADVYENFDQEGFIDNVLQAPWNDLELKDRMYRIANSIVAFLPSGFSSAIKIVDQAVSHFDGYLAMFFPEFVALKFAENESKNWHPVCKALARYTQYSSSEFAVRPMIIQNQERMLKVMLAWTKNKNEHVRRLASEGCRPRLPWAMSLPTLKKDPQPILPILEELRSDDSEYVRRSVANNLNDISKDHPEVILNIAARWLQEEPNNSNRNKLVKHALRTLLKQGNSRALRMFGFRNPTAIQVKDLALAPARIKRGGELSFSFSIHCQGGLGKIRLEYAVYYLKKNGTLSPKVFKISEFDSEDSLRVVERCHKFHDLSTRKHHKGQHKIAIIVNGDEKVSQAFTLS